MGEVSARLAESCRGCTFRRMTTKNEPADQRIELRVTASEKQAIEAALGPDESVGTWIRQAIRERLAKQGG